jgi:signal transduction histidine kinase
MNRLIDDILQLAQLGKAHISLNKVQLQPILDDIIGNLLVNEDDTRDISITVSENLPDIEGDRTMIYQLFQNLLSNAVKYTRRCDKARISITTKPADKTGYVRLLVADNGIGMAPRYQQKIFDVFSRLVGENEFEGTGIGLSIVKKIVQSHGGHIEVESEVGEGSTFTISLPIVE